MSNIEISNLNASGNDSLTGADSFLTALQPTDTNQIFGGHGCKPYYKPAPEPEHYYKPAPAPVHYYKPAPKPEWKPAPIYEFKPAPKHGWKPELVYCNDSGHC